MNFAATVSWKNKSGDVTSAHVTKTRIPTSPCLKTPRQKAAVAKNLAEQIVRAQYGIQGKVRVSLTKFQA